MTLLRALGFHVSRFQQTRASRQTIGVPDLWIGHPGWQLSGWLELKAPGGRLSPAQRAWHATAHASGARVAVVHDRDELVTVLIGWGAPLERSGPKEE